MRIPQFLRKSVIRTNLYLSIGFGILIGVIFPFYAALFVHFKNEQLKWIFSLSCIGAGIIVGLTAFSITRGTIIKVVNSLSGDLQKIAKGEGDLTRKINLKSDDKLGELIMWFNLFVEKLRIMIHATKQNILFSQNQCRTLINQMNIISSIFEEIIQGNTRIREIQLRQETKVDNVKNSLQVLDDSIVIVISNVMEFFNQLDMLTNIVIKQSSVVDSVIKNISQVSKKIGTEEDNQKIQLNPDPSLYTTGFNLIHSTYSLIEKSRSNTDRIEEHLKNIDNIAVNINLIAINASIEATHAGEAGKGFQVVAGEIRKLADQANKLTTSIQKVLSEINTDTEYTIGEIKKNQDQYNGILKEVATTTLNLHTAAGNIRSVTQEVKENYKIIGNLLINLKEKIENLKQNSTYSHNSIMELQEITEQIWEQMNAMDIESLSLQHSNLDIINGSIDFEKGLKTLEEQISHYKTQDE